MNLEQQNAVVINEQNVKNRRKMCEMYVYRKKRERGCHRVSLAKFMQLFLFCIYKNYFVANIVNRAS